MVDLHIIVLNYKKNKTEIKILTLNDLDSLNTKWQTINQQKNDLYRHQQEML